MRKRRPDGGVRLTLYSPASRGGAGWYVASLAQALADAGADVHLIAPRLVPEEREPAGATLSRHVLIAGKGGLAPLPVKVARTAWRIGSTFPALFGGRRRSREILVTMFDWLPVLVAQMLWIRLLGGRLTFVVHDATPHAYALPRRLRRVEEALLRLSYRLPHRIVSMTETLREELAEVYGRSVRSTVIPLGAFDDGVPGEMPGNGTVLVFGMLRRNKRILESIDAMRLVTEELPGVRMVIAGAPHAEDPGYWRECEAALAGLEDVIRTEIGFVPEERLRELLAESDAMLLPYEDFNSQSAVAVLAAFSERVVVATEAGGIAELVRAGMPTVPIARPPTVAAIADALRAFAALPVDERRRMGREARAALVDHLSWERIGGAFVELIAER